MVEVEEDEEDQEEEQEGEDEDVATIFTRIAGGQDAANSPTGWGLSLTTNQIYSTNPTGSTPASTFGSLLGPGWSLETGAVGLGITGDKLRKAREELRAHLEKGGSKTDPTGRKLRREIKASTADTAQGTAAMAGNIVNIPAGRLTNIGGASTAAAYGTAAAGGAIGAAVALTQMIRYARKADKARRRYESLSKLMANEQDPASALRASEKRFKLVQADWAEANAALKQADKVLADANRKDRKRLYKAWDKLDEKEDRLYELKNEARADRDNQRRLCSAQKSAVEEMAEEAKAAEKAGTRDSNEPSLLEIQAYAVYKNERGQVKKALAAVSAALGFAGSAAGVVAAIAIAAGAAAGATILAATPVGWAFAGGAVLFGLGLATYQAWKWLRKRWNQTGSLAQTLAFWKKAGASKREAYAATLYRMATNQSAPTTQLEAQKTIRSLGLDWTAMELKEDAGSAKDLIAAKLAS